MVDLLARVLVSLLRPLLSPLGECCLESINEYLKKPIVTTLVLIIAAYVLAMAKSKFRDNSITTWRQLIRGKNHRLMTLPRSLFYQTLPVCLIYISFARYCRSVIGYFDWMLHDSIQDMTRGKAWRCFTSVELAGNEFIIIHTRFFPITSISFMLLPHWFIIFIYIPEGRKNKSSRLRPRGLIVLSRRLTGYTL